MGFSIHYRSTETMHPAQAYVIKQHAESLINAYEWYSCEPVLLEQQSNGYLMGQSKPNFFPAESESPVDHLDGLPDGTVMTLAEVLSTLSLAHGVSWEIGHDYEPEPIGRISEGIVDANLMEQLETLGSLGDLMDDIFEEEESAEGEWDVSEFGLIDDSPESTDRPEEDLDDELPRVLKFPGTE